MKGSTYDVAVEDMNSSVSTAQSDSSHISTDQGRGKWGRKAEFFLSCVGYAVGLGNVWRFPYLAYRNGGGAFLIPYAIMLLITGLPLFFMELAFGQFASQGPITMWRAAPLMKGVGWGMVVVSFMVALYYNVIIAWTLHYFFASMTSQLPWQFCSNVWNTPLCASVRQGALKPHDFQGEKYVVTGLNASYLNKSWVDLLDETTNNSPNLFERNNVSCMEVESGAVSCNLTEYPVNYLWHFGLKLVSPAEEYWNKRVLQRSAGIEETGEVLWELALCLLLAWVIICMCLIKGVKSSGKVVYFTATFPYIVLTILLVRGCLLDGAINGINFYIIPKFDKLNDSAVWKDAASQIFYSLGVGFGGLPVMASFNQFKNNCLVDAVAVSLINCCTSVFAGFAIFSMIGYLSFKTGLPVEDAATSGPGLAFVAYPEGITTMPVAPLWSLLFFFMLFTLGLDSQFAMVETVTSGLTDEFPSLAKGQWKLHKITVTGKMLFTIIICILMFALGLPMTTQAGMYWFQILDLYSASYCLLMIVFFEVVGVIYIYGIKKFIQDIEIMLGSRHIGHWTYFIVCWAVLSPVSIVFIFIFSILDYSPITYEDVKYPQWGEILCWLVAASSMIMIPVWAVITYCQKSGHYKYVILAAQPDPEWGPASEEDRKDTSYDRTLPADSPRQDFTTLGHQELNHQVNRQQLSHQEVNHQQLNHQKLKGLNEPEDSHYLYGTNSAYENTAM